VAAKCATRDARRMLVPTVILKFARFVQVGSVVTRITGISVRAYISSETCAKCKSAACSNCLEDREKGDTCGSEWQQSLSSYCGEFICFDCESPDYDEDLVSWFGLSLCSSCIPAAVQTLKCGDCQELYFDCGESPCLGSARSARLSKKYGTKGK
jgi:hypothetical protein